MIWKSNWRWCLTLGKLGRKISCNYNKDMRCIGLTDGKKICYLIREDEERFNEKHEMEFVFCPFFPESKMVALMAVLKEQGFSIAKRWTGGL